MAPERVDSEPDDGDVLGHASLHGPERERHRVLAAGHGDQRQLHLHPDPQPRGVGLGQPRLHPHFAGQLDVADAVRLELLRFVARIGRRLRPEALDRPRPERPPSRKAARTDVRRRAARAGPLPGKRDRPAPLALRAEQDRRGRRAGDQVRGDGREDAHAAARSGSRVFGGTPTIARISCVNSSATRVSGTTPLGRYQCQMLL